MSFNELIKLKEEFKEILKLDEEITKEIYKEIYNSFENHGKNSVILLSMIVKQLEFSNKANLLIMSALLDINSDIGSLHSSFCSAQGWD